MPTTLHHKADNKAYCGCIAIIGRPNVGKSTLLNQLLAKKISITSKKPQTTRHQILGIKTQNNRQAIYVDTPGLHKQAKRALNRSMNKAASSILKDVDIIIFMIDARRWTEEDELVLNKLQNLKTPVILALNKTDLVKDKSRLLPRLQQLSEKYPFKSMIPIAALKNDAIDKLENAVYQLLPENNFLFDASQITTKDDKFLLSEIIREKIIRATGQEVPHDITVNIESMQLKNNIWHIDVVIWVERPGQKVIIIGKKGDKLKLIGTQSRKDIEKHLHKKIYLTLWVKVKTGWSDDEKTLLRLGYA